MQGGKSFGENAKNFFLGYGASRLLGLGNGAALGIGAANTLFKTPFNGGEHFKGGACSPKMTRKYLKRPSPPIPANACKRTVKRGNDGNLYENPRDKNGIRHWRKLSFKFSPHRGRRLHGGLTNAELVGIQGAVQTLEQKCAQLGVQGYVETRSSKYDTCRLRIETYDQALLMYDELDKPFSSYAGILDSNTAYFICEMINKIHKCRMFLYDIIRYQCDRSMWYHKQLELDDTIARCV